MEAIKKKKLDTFNTKMIKYHSPYQALYHIIVCSDNYWACPDIIKYDTKLNKGAQGKLC